MAGGVRLLSRRMSRNYAIRCGAVVLALCFLLLNGLVYVQTVPHATHHAHHKATTHGNALCSWMCAAGQGLEVIQVVLHAQISPFTVLDVAPSENRLGIVGPPSHSRAPPVSFI